MPVSDNKIITTVTKVVDDDFVVDVDNIICIDASTNRIGIGTVDPAYSLDISGSSINSNIGIRVGNITITPSNILVNSDS